MTVSVIVAGVVDIVYVAAGGVVVVVVAFHQFDMVVALVLSLLDSA